MKTSRNAAVCGSLIAVSALALGAWTARRDHFEEWGVAGVHPNLDERTPDGGRYNPATQSFLRGHHWLDSMQRVKIDADARHVGRLALQGPDQNHSFSVRNLPLEQLVPRLHYRAASPPDGFDALNLMLAEYSRNGLSVPVGQPGDEIAHFETSLSDEVPWHLGEGDYSFLPNRHFRPFRFAVINNCLTPGSWEFAAVDRAGEIYHAWFDFPPEAYFRLVGAANNVDAEFARGALGWTTAPARLELRRLREEREDLGTTTVSVVEGGGPGFSSQDSRRKLARNFALVGREDDLRRPVSRSELTAGKVFFSEFVPPGKYSLRQRRPFDLRFLADPVAAQVRRVHPLTRYGFGAGGEASGAHDPGDGYIEIDIQLDGRRLVIGNLPIGLLVPQEDFAIHGFGVGVLASDGLAEQRKLLLEQGPAPSFAYLVEQRNGVPMALNSHEFGIEQVFLRTHSQDPDPWWEITIASYERIVDLIKYRVDIPASLREELRQHALAYISPVYFTYRDDNLR